MEAAGEGWMAGEGWIVRLGGEDCSYEACNPPAQEVHLKGDEVHRLER